MGVFPLPCWFVLFVQVLLTNPTAASVPSNLVTGLSPVGWPKNYSGIPQQFASLASVGMGFKGGTNWRTSMSTTGILPQLGVVEAELTKQHNLSSWFMILGWKVNNSVADLSLPNSPGNYWANAPAADAYVKLVAKYVSVYHPPVVFLGNEIDAYYLANSSDYVNYFVPTYERARAAIKAVAPNTRVGVIFQYERVAGMGGNVGFRTPHWQAVDAFNLTTLDVVGLTMYPMFNASSVDLISPSYLTPLLSRLQGHGSLHQRIVISETGWPHDGLFLPWKASSAQQVAFVNTLFSFPWVQDGSALALGWAFYNHMALVPGNTYKTFAGVSLRDVHGVDYPVMSAWLTGLQATSW